MKADEYGIDLKKGVLNRGNTCRIRRAMKKAMRGEPVTIGFIGGSITQGCNASAPEDCYAYRVYQWWCGRFPQSAATYVNAGIGGTTSQFGVARADSDLLSKGIDLAVVEFSVNDDDTPHFQETYEGLVRKILYSERRPAVLIVNSVRYDNGKNAQAQHLKVGKAYGIPCVSMKPVIYEKVLDHTFTSRDVTDDDLHPNDLGHCLMAETITDLLEEIFRDLDDEPDMCGELDEMLENITPISENAYETSVRYQNDNCEGILTASEGFLPDLEPQEDIRDIFRRGWTADKEGAHIRFRAEGTCIGVQYRKSVRRPAPVAVAIVDGDEENAIELDAGFGEDWGDCLYLETVAEHLPDSPHTIEIRLVQAHAADQVPFYLVSVIVSK